MNWKSKVEKVVTLSCISLLCLTAETLLGDTLAHWTFDEAAGATTLIDSVNGLNGTAMSSDGIVSPPLAGSTGQIGGAWSFPGPAGSAGGYIDLTPHVSTFSGLTAGTISAWFTTTDGTAANALISAYDSTVGSTEGRIIMEGNGVMTWDVRDQSAGLTGEGGSVGGAVVNDGNWHHAVVTVDNASNAAFYVDGALIEAEQEPFWGNITTPLDGMAIGRNVDSGTAASGGQWFWEGMIDDLYIYDFVISESQVGDVYQAGLQGQSLEIGGVTEASIDRDTGQLTITNNASAFTMTGYAFRSAAGALDPGQWLSIADNYDASNPGPDQVDPNDEWVKLTDPSVRTDLSEFEPDGDGAVIGNGQSINLGNAWLKNPAEDVTLDLLLDDGTVNTIGITFSNGPNDAPYEFGDLDFDGDFDVADFENEFVPGFGADTSGLQGVELYQAGDFNEDGTVDEFDFLIYNAAFLAANPGAAPLPPPSVPEPGSLLLLSMALLGVYLSRRSSCGAGRRIWATVLTCFVGMLLLGSFQSSAHADLLAHFDPNVVTTMFSDGGAAGGTIPVSGIGDTVGFISDSRSPTPGGPQDGFMDAENLGPPSVGSHPSGFVMDFFGGDKLLVRDGNFDNQDGFGTDLDTNTMTIIAVGQINAGGTGPQYLFDVRDDLGNGGTTVNTNNGFGLRYNHDTGLLEGVAKQADTVSTPLNTGEYFVATYAWDGIAGMASLNVLTSDGGSTTVTGAADTSAVDADRFRIGARADNSQTLVGNMGDFLLYNDALDHSSVANQLADDYFNISGPSIDVNTATGQVTLGNDSSVARDIDLYRIRSAGNSLNTGGWISLDDSDFDSGAWTELSVLSSKVSEGSFGGSTEFVNGSTVSLGALYDTGVNAQDLIFEYHIVGNSPTLLVTGEVNYVTTGPPCDLDGDSDCDIDDLDDLYDQIDAGTASNADIATWLSDAGAANGKTYLPGDTNLDGDVGGTDFTNLAVSFGNTGLDGQPIDSAYWGNGNFDGDASGSFEVGGPDFTGLALNFGFTSVGNAESVPEPGSAGLLLMAIVTMGLIRRKRTWGSHRMFRWSIFSGVAVVTLLSLVGGRLSLAAVTNDRDYQLGDDGAEGAVANQLVGSGNGFGDTFDSAGTPNAGDLQDLNVNGNPQYASVADRPGASPASLGVSFDPTTSDALSIVVSMNAPSQMWDNSSFFPAGFPHNYEGIFSHGIQLWAKPNSATTDVRQQLVRDTTQHGVFITNQDTWGLSYDAGNIDSGVPVAFDQWSHVMELAGFSRPVEGNTAQRGMLLVNGVAVAASGSTYDPEDTPLSIGANVSDVGTFTADSHYHGLIDDVRLFLWGDNTGQDNGGSGPFGQNWGTLNLGTDNDWIAMELDSMNVTDVADVNLDGQVAGDGSGPAATDDVRAFVDVWLSERIVSGQRVGDWVSRQNGDLNYDGITDLLDAHLLHEGLVVATGQGLDYSLLVPEPSGMATMAGIAVFVIFVRRNTPVGRGKLGKCGG